ncbi:MAG: sulfite exporter TauE/SafE family protein, partial [Nitrososphaeraceae archaeon]
MVGLVLGVVRFPLVMSVETSVSITAGTNLGVSTLGAITAAIRHYHQKNIQFRAFIFLAITGAAGAFIGSFFTSYVPVVLLLIIIGLIVSYESFALLNGSRIRKKRRNNITNNQLDETANSDRILTLSKNRLILLESIIGFGIGFLGGLVGLVLGSIRMPAMISVLKMQPRVAIGTNLAAASVMGVSGLIGHIINNNIDYLVLMVMGSAAMIGGYLGARYTNRFSDTSLKRIIGIVLIVVAITMFLRVFQITT